MARINWIADYAIPSAVGLVELGLKTWDRKRLQSNPEAMEFEPLAPYTLAVLGTGSRMFDVLPKHDENIKMAVAASMPRVFTGIYDWATSAVQSRTAGKTRAVRARPIREVVAQEQPGQRRSGYRYF